MLTKWRSGWFYRLRSQLPGDAERTNEYSSTDGRKYLKTAILAVFSAMINAIQIRAARAILQLSQQELADRTDLSRDAIKSAERDGARPFASSLDTIETFFRQEGLSFAQDEGGVAIRYATKANSNG